MHPCLHPLQPAQEMERPLTQDLVTAELLSSALCSPHDLNRTLFPGLWTRSVQRFIYFFESQTCSISRTDGGYIQPIQNVCEASGAPSSRLQSHF